MPYICKLVYDMILNYLKKEQKSNNVVNPLTESNIIHVAPFVKPIDKDLERLRDPFIKYV